jgi:hypothetical protein
VLIYDPVDGSRLAIVAEVPPELVQRWSVHKQYIALVEQTAIVLGLTECPTRFYKRDVIWWEDNSVVLAGMCKGANHGEDLDAGTTAIHLMVAQLRMRPWWEYVESKANWSDSASRLGEADPWIKKHGFHVRTGTVPLWPWFGTAETRLSQVRKSVRINGPAVGSNQKDHRWV